MTANASFSPTDSVSDAAGRLPRSEAVPRNWRTFNWGSAFSSVIYPLLGVAVLVGAVVAAQVYDGLELHLWYLLPMTAAAAGCIVLCNFGIGSLHRVWQHRGARMKGPAQVFVALNCILAMQGPIREWINYHALHHRFADKPGDPHNPHESTFWAWIGWVLWRDPEDIRRPWAKWIADNRVVRWADRFQMPLSAMIHLVVPLVMYALVYAFDGSLLLAALVHAAAVIARGLHFHATTMGINVCGHLNVPAWVTWTLALATGGEAFHDHHHAYPRSILHLPARGLINRLVDYNGTFLLALRKLGMLDHERIAPQFA